MSYNNATIHKATAYVPNANAISAPTLQAGDLGAASFSDAGNDYIGKRWPACTPSVKYALKGLTASGAPKLSAWSSPASPAAPLTAGQALVLTIPDTELADNPLGVVVAANEGSGLFKVVADIPLPAQYMRENVAPAADFVITIPHKPYSGLPGIDLIDKALASDASAVYGGTAYDLGLELGDAGVAYNHAPTNFATNANNIVYKFSVSKGCDIVLNINPMNSVTYETLLKFVGYLAVPGGRAYGHTVPLSTIVLDIDEDPHIDGGSKFMRRVAWSVGIETLEAANISKQYNNKEGIAITLPSYPSVYSPLGMFFVGNETVY